MPRRSYTEVAVHARGVVVVVALAIIVAVFIFEQRRTQAEFGAVLSAYLSDEVLHNAHDWGSGPGIQVILQREAQQPGTWGWRCNLLFDRRLRFPQASSVTRTSFVLNNAAASDIRAELRLPSGVDIVTLSRGELERWQTTDFQRRFPKNFGYIAVSQAGFNFSKTEAILYIDHFCGLCGGGSYILMHKVNGLWRVVDEHSTRMS
jgi:hypothetical protein